MATVVLLLGGSLLLASCSTRGEAPAPPAAEQQAAPDTAATTTTDQSPPTATDQDRSVKERLEDASLAARVKTALAEDRRLRAFDFDPRVTSARVTLDGNVATRAQGQAAADVASEVEGVDEVFNRLTVDGQQVAWDEPDKSADDAQVAAAQSPAPPGPSDGSASGSTYHTVQTGESLWAIANEYGTTVSQVKALNNLRSNSLRAGERLLVKQGNGASGSSSEAALADAEEEQASQENAAQPGVSAGGQEASPEELSFFKGGPSEKGSSGEASSKGAASNEEEEASEYYVVKSGESLWAIAQENGITVARLKELNDLSSNSLMPGDRLRVE